MIVSTYIIVLGAVIEVLYCTIDYVAICYIMVLIRSVVHDYFEDLSFHVTWDPHIYSTNTIGTVPYGVREKPVLSTSPYYQHDILTLCCVTD